MRKRRKGKKRRGFLPRRSSSRARRSSSGGRSNITIKMVEPSARRGGKRRGVGRGRRRGMSGRKALFRRAGALLLTGGLTIAAAAGVTRLGALQAANTQQYTGVSIIGWVGLGLFGITAAFVRSPALADLGYGVSISLILYEIDRQISSDFSDFRVLFGAPSDGAVLEGDALQAAVEREARRQAEELRNG